MSDLIVNGSITADDGLTVSSGGATIIGGATFSGTTAITHNGNTVLDTSSKIPVARLPYQTSLTNTSSYVPTSSAVYAMLPTTATFSGTNYSGYVIRFPNIKTQFIWATYSASMGSDSTSSLISFSSYPFSSTSYVGFVTANTTTSSGNNTDIGGYFVPSTTTGFYIRNDGGKSCSTFYILAIGLYS